MIKIGLDLDNTIIIYDKLFKKIAIEENLVPIEIEPTKYAIREHLRKTNRENEFTILQSIVYGKRILDAELAIGFLDFLNKVDHRIELYIISHKTMFPIKGERFNLHKAAMSFLSEKKIIGSSQNRIKESNIFFEATIKEKLNRISKLNCNYFIDDLPKIINDIDSKTIPILYNPNRITYKKSNYDQLFNWKNLHEKINYTY